MTALLMRDALEADLPAIVAMLADDPLGAAREDASTPLDPAYHAAFHAIEADANQRLILAEQDGAPVGTLQLSFLPGLSYRGGWIGQIEAVRIASPLRGRGLGTRLIDWALARCRERGCHHVQLISSTRRPEAHRFYEQRGFAKSHLGMTRSL